MRPLLIAGTLAGLIAAASGARAQPIGTGPEANKYLFMFYAIDDMAREFSLPEIEAIKKNSGPTVYADRIGALATKRTMTLNSFRRHAEVIQLDEKCFDGIAAAAELLKAVKAYGDELKDAQNSYDLGLRQIQAKLYTNAELQEKLLQKSVDAEQYYLDLHELPDRGKSRSAMDGVLAGLKRRAVAEYQIAKTKQKLAEDVHRDCLKYEAEHGPELAAKIEAIHRGFVANYPAKHWAACESIVAKVKPLAPKMGVSEGDVYMVAARKDFNWETDGKDRTKDPFRYIQAARRMKSSFASEGKKAYVFARECIKAVELVPAGDSRDTTEVFLYYRGLLSGWAATIATRAAAVQLGTDSLEKAYRSPPEGASTAMYCWRTYESYEKAGAFPKAHTVSNSVMADAYGGKIEDALKLHAKHSFERIDDPYYWYTLARLCGIYKFGGPKNVEKFRDDGIGYMREATLLGFALVEEARYTPDFENYRKDAKLSAKLITAMFEPDNLFKLTRRAKDARPK